AGGESSAHRLDDKQRVALCFVKQAHGRFDIQRMVGELACQLGGFRCVEWLERNLDDLRDVAEVTQQGVQRMLGANFLRARCAYQQEGRVGCEAQEKVQPLQRFFVAPLQVVDEQQQRAGSRTYGACERLKESLALPIFTDWQGRRQIWIL